jgi:ATP-dependent Clp protease ATP-binding subunit ClpA
MTREKESAAGKTLGRLGVTDETVAVILPTVRSGAIPQPSQRRVVTARVQRIVELAFSQASEARAATVTSGHLLEGLVLEGSGAAAAMLIERGISLDVVTSSARASDVTEGDVYRLLEWLYDSQTAGRSSASRSWLLATHVLAAEEAAADLDSAVAAGHFLRAMVRHGDALVIRALTALGVPVESLVERLKPPRHVLELRTQLREAGKRSGVLENRPNSPSAMSAERERDRLLDELSRAEGEWFGNDG